MVATNNVVYRAQFIAKADVLSWFENETSFICIPLTLEIGAKLRWDQRRLLLGYLRCEPDVYYLDWENDGWCLTLQLLPWMFEAEYNQSGSTCDHRLDPRKHLPLWLWTEFGQDDFTEWPNLLHQDMPWGRVQDVWRGLWSHFCLCQFPCEQHGRPNCDSPKCSSCFGDWSGTRLPSSDWRYVLPQSAIRSLFVRRVIANLPSGHQYASRGSHCGLWRWIRTCTVD